MGCGVVERNLEMAQPTNLEIILNGRWGTEVACLALDHNIA